MPTTKETRLSTSVASKSVNQSIMEEGRDTDRIYDWEQVKTQDPTDAYKIILAGSKGVGKTTLLRVLSEKCDDDMDFTRNMTPSISVITMGAGARKDRTKLTLTVAGVAIQAVVWDTGDMEVHNGSMGVTKTYFRDSDGVILIYKKSDPSSMTKLNEWALTAREHSPQCIFSIWCNNVTEQFGSGHGTRDMMDSFIKTHNINDKLCFTYTTEDKPAIHSKFQQFVQHINCERRGKPSHNGGDTITVREETRFERFKKQCC